MLLYTVVFILYLSCYVKVNFSSFSGLFFDLTLWLLAYNIKNNYIILLMN